MARHPTRGIHRELLWLDYQIFLERLLDPFSHVNAPPCFYLCTAAGHHQQNFMTLCSDSMPQMAVAISCSRVIPSTP